MKKLLYLFLTIALISCGGDDDESNNDTTPPVITLIGSANVTLNQGDNYIDEGATATDNVDGDLTSSISVSGNVDTATIGNYTLTYSVSDSSGNSASATRNISVQELISCEGDAPVYLHPNGVTIVAKEWAQIGDRGFFNGICYTIADRDMIRTDAYNEHNITAYCTSRITDMTGLLSQLPTFNQDISSWDVSSVTEMQSMFSGSFSFNQDLSNWDVSSVTNMEYMFKDNENFNQDISGWDVSSVTDMEAMFQNSGRFNQDISVWDVSNVTEMYRMFKLATNFNQNLSSWNVISVFDCAEFSDHATNWTLPKPNFTNCWP